MNTISQPRHRLVRELAFAAALVAAIFSPGMMLASDAAESSPQGPQQPPDLIAALKATPGVLGVDAARTMSGKQVIFAWFENKQAVLNWFYSDTHQRVMQMFTPGASSGRKPLADVPDDSGPILAIASLTMTDQPGEERRAGVPGDRVDGVLMPVSQIAIELYTPLPGGLAAGGRFAPSSVNVPGLVEAPSSRGPR